MIQDVLALNRSCHSVVVGQREVKNAPLTSLHSTSSASSAWQVCLCTLRRHRWHRTPLTVARPISPCVIGAPSGGERFVHDHCSRSPLHQQGSDWPAGSGVGDDQATGEVSFYPTRTGEEQSTTTRNTTNTCTPLQVSLALIPSAFAALIEAVLFRMENHLDTDAASFRAPNVSRPVRSSQLHEGVARPQDLHNLGA